MTCCQSFLLSIYYFILSLLLFYCGWVHIILSIFIIFISYSSIFGISYLSIPELYYKHGLQLASISHTLILLSIIKSRPIN